MGAFAAYLDEFPTRGLAGDGAFVAATAGVRIKGVVLRGVWLVQPGVFGVVLRYAAAGT